MSARRHVTLAVVSLSLLVLVRLVGAADLHAVIVADSADQSIGQSVKIDVGKLREELAKIDEHTSLRVRTTVIEGTDITRDNVLGQIADLSCGADDVILFYYSGHGFRTADSEKPWPMMALRGQKGLDQYDVFYALYQKKPRLLLVVCDCCNTLIPESVVNIGRAGLEWKTAQLKANYRELFEQSHGALLAASAKPGEYALGNDRDGGLFTQALLGSMRASLMAATAPTWESVLSGACRRIALGEERHQSPLYKSFYGANESGGTNSASIPSPGALVSASRQGKVYVNNLTNEEVTFVMRAYDNADGDRTDQTGTWSFEPKEGAYIVSEGKNFFAARCHYTLKTKRGERAWQCWHIDDDGDLYISITDDDLPKVGDVLVKNNTAVPLTFRVVSYTDGFSNDREVSGYWEFEPGEEAYIVSGEQRISATRCHYTIATKHGDRAWEYSHLNDSGDLRISIEENELPEVGQVYVKNNTDQTLKFKLRYYIDGFGKQQEETGYWEFEPKEGAFITSNEARLFARKCHYTLVTESGEEAHWWCSRFDNDGDLFIEIVPNDLP